MEIPTGGYWHCQISLEEKGAWPLNEMDKDYSHIIECIVRPYRENREFIFSGKRIKNRNHIRSIKIVYTEQNAAYYGQKSLSSPGVFIMAPDRILAYDNGKEFTQYLLNSANFEPDPKPKDQNSAKGQKIIDQTININQSNNQNQSTNINISLQFNGIEKLQEAFEDWRLSFENLEEREVKRLREAQDSLDVLSPASSAEHACGALNKVRRILTTARDAGSEIGKAIAGTANAMGDISRLKDAYNAVAGSFNLPLF
jgi:hypothetical protein